MYTNRAIEGVGIGLRHQHFSDVLEQRPDVPWFEVHSENFFAPGSTPNALLEQVREHYPLSAHCVGLSLASADLPDARHVQAVRDFIMRYEPGLVSDHLSWSAADGVYVNDLLPVPYTEEALDAVVRNIMHVQEVLGRQIVIENPSSYVQFAESAIPEWEFLVAAAEQSGCGILLDVNNIYVSAFNHGYDARAYLAAIPAEMVQEIHLAGYSAQEIDGNTVLIDDHGARVYEEVWALYAGVVERLGAVPTLIEWDTNVPAFSVLLEEKHKADALLNQRVVQAKKRAGGVR